MVMSHIDIMNVMPELACTMRVVESHSAWRLHLCVVGVDSYFIVNRLNYFHICKQ